MRIPASNGKRPVLKRRRYAIRISIAAISIFATCGGKPELILIASGSEVSLCIKAHEELLAEGISSRVVSMPSWDIFEHLSEAYQESVLLPEVTATHRGGAGLDARLGTLCQQEIRPHYPHEDVRRVSSS
jgi:transketolase